MFKTRFRSRTRFVAGCLLTAFTLLTGSLSSASNKNFGIIDVMKVIGESEVYNSVAKDVEKRKEQYYKSIEPKGEELRRKHKLLESRKGKMSNESFAKANDNIRREVIKLERDSNAKLNELNEMYQDASKAIMEKVRKIAEKISSKGEFAFVVEKNLLVAYDMNRFEDISAHALKLLNSEMPSYDFKTKTKNDESKSEKSDEKKEEKKSKK